MLFYGLESQLGEGLYIIKALLDHAVCSVGGGGFQKACFPTRSNQMIFRH